MPQLSAKREERKNKTPKPMKSSESKRNKMVVLYKTKNIDSNKPIFPDKVSQRPKSGMREDQGLYVTNMVRKKSPLLKKSKIIEN